LGPVVGGLNGLDQRPKGVDLADMVNQSEQRPLYIHFPLGTQGKAMHPFLHTDVRKDRFDDPQPSGIDALADFTIDLHLHLIDQVGLLAVDLDGKIPGQAVGQTGGALAATVGLWRGDDDDRIICHWRYIAL